MSEKEDGGPREMTWMGTPISAIAREDLIKALSWAGEEINRLIDSNARNNDFFVDFIDAALLRAREGK